MIQFSEKKVAFEVLDETRLLHLSIRPSVLPSVRLFPPSATLLLFGKLYKNVFFTKTFPLNWVKVFSHFGLVSVNS